MLVLELLLLFAAGLLQDALNTHYVRAVAEQARLRAAILSVIVTVVGFLVFARIVAQVAELDAAGTNLAAYALGNGAGTWVGMRRPTAPA